GRLPHARRGRATDRGWGVPLPGAVRGRPQGPGSPLLRRRGHRDRGRRRARRV
ncbi:MAG: hypothetical protein AVDCRST_MAG17-2293, partial [uncultured Solirubrobacterales bacterium]